MRQRSPGSVISAVIAGLIALAGCAEEPTRPPVEGSSGSPRIGGGAGGSDSVARDGGSSIDGGDAGACTELAITGGVVPQQILTGDVPSGLGGGIADGTYDLTEAVLYGGPSALPGPSGASYRGSIRVAGQSFERRVVFTSSGGAVAETSIRGTLAVSGASGTLSIACPFATQEQVTFTATGNGLVLSNLVTKESFGFTRKL